MLEQEKEAAMLAEKEAEQEEAIQAQEVALEDTQEGLVAEGAENNQLRE